MAEDTRVRIIRDGQLVITDGASLSYTLTYWPGSLSVNQPKREDVDLYDRDNIAGQRAGRQAVGTISFQAHLREVANSVSATLIDVIEKTNAWSAATSVGGASFEDFMVDVTYTSRASVSGGTADQIIVANTVKLSWDVSIENPAIINVTGKIYEGLTRTGGAS